MKPNRILLGPSPLHAWPGLLCSFTWFMTPSIVLRVLLPFFRSFIYLFTWRTIEQLRGSSIPSERTNQTRPDPHTAQDQHQPAMLTRKLSEPKAKSCPKPLPAPLQCVCVSVTALLHNNTYSLHCLLSGQEWVPLPCHWRKGC